MSTSCCIYNKTKHPSYSEDIPQWYATRNGWVQSYLAPLPGVKKIVSPEGDTEYSLPYSVVFKFFSDLAISAANILVEYAELAQESTNEEMPAEAAKYLMQRVLYKKDEDDYIVMHLLLQDIDVGLWLTDLKAVLDESDKTDEFFFAFG